MLKKLSDKDLLKLYEAYRVLTNIVPTKKTDSKLLRMIKIEISKRGKK